METASRQPVRIRKTHYTNTLRVCLIATIGVCCALLPSLPSTQNSRRRHSGDVIYALLRFAYGAAIIFIAGIGFWMLRIKEKLHRNQRVLWPLQCQHCARVVGISPPLLSSTCNKGCRNETTTDRGLARRRWSSPDLLSANDIEKDSIKNENYKSEASQTTTEDEIRNDSVNITTCHTAMPGELTSPSVSSINHDHAAPVLQVCSPTRPRKLDERKSQRSSCFETIPCTSSYKAPHKSLLVLFNLFAVIAILNVPVQLVGITMCIAITDTKEHIPVILAQTVIDLLYLLLIAVAALFFNTFYDAVFVEKGWIPKYIGAFFAVSVTQVAMKIVYPISASAEIMIDPLKVYCKLPPTFKMFKEALVAQDARLAPLYSETAVLGLGISYQMWQSIRLTCTLHLSADGVHIDALPSLSTSIRQKIRALKASVLSSRGGGGSDQENLLERRNSNIRLRVCAMYALVILVVGSFIALYSVLISIIVRALDLSPETQTYLTWCWKLSCYYPFFGMYHYQSFHAGRSRGLFLKGGILIQGGLLQGHDLILLFGSCSIFALSFFRLVASFGILIDSTTEQKDLALASFGVIHSVTCIYVVWTMTLLLLVVQRKEIKSLVERKWVKICLTYVILLSCGNWITGIALDPSTHPLLLQKYFIEPVGILLGKMLEPMISLFNIHAAIIAFQARSDIKDEERSQSQSHGPDV